MMKDTFDLDDVKLMNWRLLKKVKIFSLVVTKEKVMQFVSTIFSFRMSNAIFVVSMNISTDEKSVWLVSIDLFQCCYTPEPLTPEDFLVEVNMDQSIRKNYEMFYGIFEKTCLPLDWCILYRIVVLCLRLSLLQIEERKWREKKEKHFMNDTLLKANDWMRRQLIDFLVLFIQCLKNNDLIIVVSLSSFTFYDENQKPIDIFPWQTSIIMNKTRMCLFSHICTYYRTRFHPQGNKWFERRKMNTDQRDERIAPREFKWCFVVIYQNVSDMNKNTKNHVERLFIIRLITIERKRSWW